MFLFSIFLLDVYLLVELTCSCMLQSKVTWGQRNHTETSEALAKDMWGRELTSCWWNFYLKHVHLKPGWLETQRFSSNGSCSAVEWKSVLVHEEAVVLSCFCDSWIFLVKILWLLYCKFLNCQILLSKCSFRNLVPFSFVKRQGSCILSLNTPSCTSYGYKTVWSCPDDIKFQWTKYWLIWLSHAWTTFYRFWLTSQMRWRGKPNVEVWYLLH